jgi:hypothetical protein
MGVIYVNLSTKVVKDLLSTKVVNDLVENSLSTKLVNDTFDPLPRRCPLSSGARPVLPMGVAPKAIAKKFRV